MNSSNKQRNFIVAGIVIAVGAVIAVAVVILHHQHEHPKTHSGKTVATTMHSAATTHPTTAAVKHKKKHG